MNQQSDSQCLGVSLKHLSHVQHLNENVSHRNLSDITFYYSYSLSCHFSTVLGDKRAEDKLTAVWTIGVCVREGVHSHL